MLGSPAEGTDYLEPGYRAGLEHPLIGGADHDLSDGQEPLQHVLYHPPDPGSTLPISWASRTSTTPTTPVRRSAWFTTLEAPSVSCTAQRSRGPRAASAVVPRSGLNPERFHMPRNTGGSRSGSRGRPPNAGPPYSRSGTVRR